MLRLLTEKMGGNGKGGQAGCCHHHKPKKQKEMPPTAEKVKRRNVQRDKDIGTPQQEHGDKTWLGAPWQMSCVNGTNHVPKGRAPRVVFPGN